MRIIGAVAGYFLSDFFFHIIHTAAAGLKAETQIDRIGAVGFGILVLLLFMYIAFRFFSSSFFQGFIVATGLFLSFDIIVFHWVFQLHRITNGPEANWLEPILVLGGILFIWFGLSKELSQGKLQSKAM
ncbi:hypothetical protein [Bacillus pinisoli]|uniref:hypothetical protein n=1 Tax=Bacillus pinisoli TaxID=2901866 RepID=UPI001FF13934|nr:hypothetical protein [Bacillus pinisoli]